MATKKRKLTAQQEANKKEYNKLRDNLKARERRLLNAGYYVKPGYDDKIYAKTVTELGHNPRKSDIERLKNISKNEFNKAFYKTFYSGTGQPKEFSLDKARNIERSQAAKKAAKTRKFYKKYPEFREYDKKRKQYEANDRYIKQIDKKYHTDYELQDNDYWDNNYDDYDDYNDYNDYSSQTDEEKETDKINEDIIEDDNKTESGTINIDGKDYFVNENGELIPIPQELSTNEIQEDFDEEDYTTNDLPFNESPTEDFPENYKLPMSFNDDIETIETSKTTLEQDIILTNMNEVINAIKFQIMKLYGFKSEAKNTAKQKYNEEFVYSKADIIMDKFLELTKTNKAELANNCQAYAMQITSLIEAVKYSYRDPRSFDAIFTDLINYFVGMPSFSEESAIFAESDFNFEVGGDYIYD